ncbi:MAG: hypothetical protein RBU23_12760, partial [Candidatus Auribacterota bacterium]|nr:hypothetical protein [Candidatus Auribacterota bacterium]
PYPRRILLKKGDIKEIANITGYTYETVVYQLSGTRRIQPSVRAVADRFADRTQAELDAIKEMDINQ